MSLTVSNDNVANIVFGLPHASTTTEQQATTVAKIAAAKVRVLNFSQFFTSSLADGDSPSQPATVWDEWALLEAALMVAYTWRREIIGSLRERLEEARDLAIDTISVTSPQATTITGAALTTEWVRRIVAMRCVKRRPRVWPNTDVIDQAIHTSLNELWNHYNWNFKQRKVVFTIAANGTVSDDLATGEEMDSIAVKQLWYRDEADLCLKWAPREMMARLMADSDADTGRPQYFRLQGRSTSATWLFYPAPDAEYTVMGFVTLAGPTLPDAIDDSTEYNLFPPEFRPVIPELVLANTLKALDAAGWQEQMAMVERKMDSFLTFADDHGVHDDDMPVSDVYNDFGAFSSGGYC